MIRIHSMAAILLLIWGAAPAGAAVRELSADEFATVQGGQVVEGEVCVDNGPCGAFSDTLFPCAWQVVWNGNACIIPGAICRVTQFAGPNDVTCENSAPGPGCFGAQAAPCVTRQNWVCETQGIIWRNCECVMSGNPIGVGQHWDCVEWQN